MNSCPTTRIASLNARPAWLFAALAVVLSGCSGGGGGSAASTPASSTVTIAEYNAQRNATVSAAATVEPDAATQTALVAANYHLAVAELSLELQDGYFGALGWYSGNAAVVPPLTYAALRAIGAAANGDSLAEITNHFDLAPTPYAAAQQTGMVASQIWGERSYRFRTEYLAATDATGAPPRLAAWAATETGFADGSAGSDPGLKQALATLWVSLATFEKPEGIRMLAVNTLAAKGGWGTVTPFDGVFAVGSQDMVRLPLLRLTENVTRYGGSDFTAAYLPIGNLRVMTLRPTANTLASFAANRLEAALNEAVRVLSDAGIAHEPGEMLLPKGDIGLTTWTLGPLARAGVTRVFDEVNADLRGLDGKGGTYVQQGASYSSARLSIAADGLALNAANTFPYTHSPRNVYTGSSNYGGIAGYVLIDGYGLGGCFGRQIWPTPDLGPFFIAVLDAKGWLVTLAAIKTLPGTAVTPTCSPTPINGS